MSSPSPDPLEWSALREVVLPAWQDIDRRGAQFLFVVPIFCGPLVVAAFLVLPTNIPALFMVGVTIVIYAYLGLARRRSRRGKVLLLRGTLLQKRTQSGSGSTAHEQTRQDFLQIEIGEALELSRDGTIAAASTSPGQRPEWSTTTEIYEQVTEGEQLAAVVMPHDRAVYFIVDGGGEVFRSRRWVRAQGRPAPAARRSARGPGWNMRRGARRPRSRTRCS